MSFTQAELKQDIETLEATEFYIKHIIHPYNWYFENILGIKERDLSQTSETFKTIVSENMGISISDVLIVGSSKTGYSLSPTKNFKPFEKNPDSKNKSDIDIAIISSIFFGSFWDLFRKSYRHQDRYHYDFISRAIYRGYIDDRHLNVIVPCRQEWNPISTKSNKKLQSDLYLKHEIKYRIYRNLEDFKEYNIQSIKCLQQG